MTDTTDHAWASEHIAAYIAGGLSATEAERLEAHARECSECADALADTRRLDSALLGLFAGIRPPIELEDRAVAKLRTERPRSPILARWSSRALGAVAALLMLGAFGALVGSMADGGLPMPGAERESARRTDDPEQVARRYPKSEGIIPDKELTNEDVGLDSLVNKTLRDLETVRVIQPNLEAALPEITRIDEYTVDGIVTMDTLGRPNAPDTSGAALPALGLPTDGTVNHLWGRSSGYAVNGNTTAAFPGRSGATKSRLLKDGGGNDLNEVAYLKSYYANNSYGIKLFTPDEYRIPVAVTNNPQKEDPKKDPPKSPDPKEAKQPDNPKQPADPQPVPDPARRVILRSGEIEFEVPSFDTASASITKLVDGLKAKGAFISTINSDKLANGKVKGSITVRIPPEHLDELVAKLREELGKTGDLKGVRLAAQDVTKQYYDLESRLRAARTMEQRLLQIIKEGKGEIKLLLEAEKELGVWRTKIEEFEGELRYYANLVSLSTLTISITEKEIRAAAGLTETERVQAGIEAEDVDKTYQQMLAVIAEFKGRILKSEVKQLTAGQYNATLNFEVSPDSGGPIRDRLRQLGRVARLEIDRVTQAEGGVLPTDAKTKRGDTVFLVQIYNLVNVAARETAAVEVAVVDVPNAYQALRDAVAKASGRVLAAQLNEQDRQNVTAQLDFEVKRTEEAAIRATLDSAGEVVSRQVTRAAESDNVTDAKVLYKTLLKAANRLPPREILTLGVEVADVDGAAAVMAAQARDAGGRQVDSQFAHERSGKVTGRLIFEVPLSAAGGLAERFKSAGTVRVSQSVRNPQASEGKYATARIDVKLTNVESIVADDDGVWPQVRRGLAYSVSVLLTSVTWVVFGLCVVLPWCVLLYIGYRLVRRTLRPAPATGTTTPAA